VSSWCLRKQLIVDDTKLKFAEGTACADVLKAGEKGGSLASRFLSAWRLGGAL